MKYDDGSWHTEGDFPPELPESAGSNHIAVFLAWAALNGLGSDELTQENAEEDARLAARAVTPVDWFLAVCDERLTDEDLDEEGNAFAQAYYATEHGSYVAGGFIDDYARCFPGLPTLYHAPADWSAYDRVAPVLSERLRAWRASEAGRRAAKRGPGEGSDAG